MSAPIKRELLPADKAALRRAAFESSPNRFTQGGRERKKPPRVPSLRNFEKPDLVDKED